MGEHTVLNCDCSMPEGTYHPYNRGDIDRDVVRKLDKHDFYVPKEGTGFITKSIFADGIMIMRSVPEDPKDEPFEHECCECHTPLVEGSIVNSMRLHNDAEGTYFEVYTCVPCTKIREDFLGSGGQSIGYLREQIYVCLGFDYLGDEDWRPNLDKVPSGIKELYERLKGGQK